MDISISISELAYVCTLIMTQEYHLPSPLFLRLVLLTDDCRRHPLRLACELVFMLGFHCFSRRSIQAVLLAVVNTTDLAGKNGNGRRLVPRHDMEDPSHLKKPDFIGLSGEPY